MKLVISNPETGKSYQKELEKGQERTLYGKKIKDSVKGDTLGLSGYEFTLTGGSDKQGFPMRADFHGTSRKQLLLTRGPGYYPKRKGERRRKSVRGNTVSEEIAQLNLKVVKKGGEALEKLFGKTEGKTAEKKEEPKKEEVKKEEVKKEEKPVEKKEEKKKEEKPVEKPEEKKEAAPEKKDEKPKDEKKPEEKA